VRSAKRRRLEGAWFGQGGRLATSHISAAAERAAARAPRWAGGAARAVLYPPNRHTSHMLLATSTQM